MSGTRASLATVPDRPLSLGPASRLLGVDPDTLRRWADEGRIEAFTTSGGHRRFSRGAVERILEARRHDATMRLANLGATQDRLSRAYRRGYASVADVGDVREAIPEADRRVVPARLEDPLQRRAIEPAVAAGRREGVDPAFVGPPPERVGVDAEEAAGGTEGQRPVGRDGSGRDGHRRTPFPGRKCR